MLNNAMIYLIDVATVQDETTGERTRVIQTINGVAGEKSIVGMNTFWQASANDVRLDCSAIVRKVQYKNQKFVYIDDLYEVYNTGKSAQPIDVLLNMNISKDDVLKELVKDALGIS